MGFDFRRGYRTLFSKSSTMPPQLTESLIESVRGHSFCGCGVSYQLPSSFESKDGCNYAFNLPYACTDWSLIKYRDNFTYTLTQGLRSNRWASRKAEILVTMCGKGKVVLVQAMRTYGRRGGLGIPIFNLGTRWRCRSQWPRGLRRRYAVERLLESWVRTPPRAWMSVSCECLCCQVEVSVTGRSLVPRSPTDCGVCLSVIK
jgi:hypothetical protein